MDQSFTMTEEEYRRNLHNALATANSAIHMLMYGRSSWDDRMKMVDSLQRVLPIIRRILIYFKNKEAI